MMMLSRSSRPSPQHVIFLNHNAVLQLCCDVQALSYKPKSGVLSQTLSYTS